MTATTLRLSTNSTARRWTRSEWILLVAIGVGLLHHTDHVLRVDHSGWPFRPDVNPFTFSLVAYPLLLTVLLARSRPWLRVMGITLGFTLTVGAHVLIESPAQQYTIWATGRSLDPVGIANGYTNLLHTQNPVLGVLAVIVAQLLHLALFASLVSLLADALAARRARAVAARQAIPQ